MDTGTQPATAQADPADLSWTTVVFCHPATTSSGLEKAFNTHQWLFPRELTVNEEPDWASRGGLFLDVCWISSVSEEVLGCPVRVYFSERLL